VHEYGDQKGMQGENTLAAKDVPKKTLWNVLNILSNFK